jgi:hypothetical protein
MGVGFALQWVMTLADIWLPHRDKGSDDPVLD